MTAANHIVGLVFDRDTAVRELGLVSELFHRINRIIPENQRLLELPPEMTAREAISLLKAGGYSQAPVILGGQVIGVFSHRSFARTAAESTTQEIVRDQRAPGDLPVDECLEPFEFARVNEEMQKVFGAMGRDNGVLIGTPERLQGILTPMDFLHYLYKLASPFVMISEVELTLRALIRRAVTQDELETCAARCLESLYGAGKVPKTLESMTFDNYRAIVAHGVNWPLFEPVLGGSRTRTAAKLQQLCDLRNDVFHFKRQISLQDHETLSNHREWLLLQAKKADIRRGAGGQR